MAREVALSSGAEPKHTNGFMVLLTLWGQIVNQN